MKFWNAVDSSAIHTTATNRQAHTRGVQKIRRMVVRTTIETGSNAVICKVTMPRSRSLLNDRNSSAAM